MIASIAVTSLTMDRFLPALLTALLLNPAAAAEPEAAQGTDPTPVFSVPEGFEARTLEPLGGQVARPNGWFYRESHDAASFKWVLSAENPEDGPYQTGVRIQLIAAVQAKTGQDARTFIGEFLDGRRASAKVLEECPVEDQGLLTRTCIQTEESIPSASTDEPFRIQYTVFWGNQVDVALFVTAGTLASQWEQYAPIFAEIEKFQLIDLERFAEGGSVGAGGESDTSAKPPVDEADSDAADKPADG